MKLIYNDLARWRTYLNGNIDSSHLILASDWRFCAIGERIEKDGDFLSTVEELSPEAKVLGIDFYLLLIKDDKKRAFEILEIIEKMPTIWKHKK